jgi:Ni,Fe-hydrogenase maturation factor
MAVVVFAVGKPSRGDDALGPLLMAGSKQRRPASGW